MPARISTQPKAAIAPPTVLYLASQSPRRRQLLHQLGVPHELLLPGSDEDAEALEAVLPGELPAVYVQRVTALKLRAALQRLKHRQLPPGAVLAADTTVAVGRRILGKPQDAADARRMLTLLSGRTHRVLTAVALHSGRRSRSALSVTHVRFAVIPASEIEAYVRSGEPFGKAGAYAIQGALAAWIARIEGSYTGVVGLALHETAQLLRWGRIGLSGYSSCRTPRLGGDAYAHL